MLFAGIDLGSTYVKACVMEGLDRSWTLRWSHACRCDFNAEALARRILEEAAACCATGGLESFDGICATGYGRRNVGFIDSDVSEISCHAAGAHWALPSVRTVVDVGGQDLKVIRVADDGSLVDFAMNDKCAAGTGRFLEGMARILHCDLAEMSGLAEQAEQASRITSTCSVFAETEVVSLINDGEPRCNIAAGVFECIAERIFAMSQRVGIAADVMCTGGGSKSPALLRALSRRCGVEPACASVDPQLIGAIGAALMAARKAEGGKGR